MLETTVIGMIAAGMTTEGPSASTPCSSRTTYGKRSGRSGIVRERMIPLDT
jgi:hypothetical protein